MTMSSHERDRGALTALAGDEPTLSIASEAGERCGWWTRETHPQALCRIDMFERRCAAALMRSRRHARELAIRVPCLADLLDAIVDRLAELHAQWPSREPRPIHGSPHPSQWLDAGSAIGLVDFDRFGRGDPELDAGILFADFDALDAPAGLTQTEAVPA